MAVYYDYSIIEEIKYRCDIEDVIASYLPLKRAGSNLNGLCPFHSEKTPSFTVFSHSKSFYCFGCGAGGDVLTFIKRIENIDYPAAIEFLAKRAGISIAQNDVNENETVKKQRIIEMNVAAAKFFRDNLIESKIACDYLSNRNLSSSAIRRFGLGWAPESFNKLTDHLSGLGYSELEMTTGFLSRKSEKNNKMYDLFRGRIIFPIIDVSGNVVAFGGRIIGDGMPKYLNSSDTPAFKKSRNLFALNYAKKNCAENIILCEGYMDVIALHEAGFTSAVATLGTAITAEQARIIKKYTNKVIISYDSDEAGQRAANKAFNLLGEAGLDVSILRMADAKDPDEYIKKYGSAKFKSLLDNSVSRFDFEFSNILAKYNISVTEEKIKAAKDTVDYISNVYSTVERELYINKAAEKLGLSFESIKNDVQFKIQRNNYKKKAG